MAVASAAAVSAAGAVVAAGAAQLATMATKATMVSSTKSRLLVCIRIKREKASSRFWFAKKTQVLMREETSMPDGSTLVKTLLNPESGDAKP